MNLYSKIMYKYIFITLSALLTFFSSATAQENRSTLNYIIQYSGHTSTGENAPYWFAARRQGMYNIDPNSSTMRIGLLSSGHFDKRGKFEYRIGADIRVGETYSNSMSLGTGFTLQQACFDIQYNCLQISIGSKERFSEASHTYLTPFGENLNSNLINQYFPNIYSRSIIDLGSGGLAYSGNSRPVPQVRIEIPEYTPFPGTNGWLHVRGHIAYGAFTDEKFQSRHTEKSPSVRYGKSLLYHSKAGFLRIGKAEKFPLLFEGGLEMHTQFGGDIYTHADGKILSMPHGLADYWKAFIPLSGSDATPEKEQTNISGNQLGSWHAAFIIPTKKVEIRLYGEHLFEDFSQLFFFEYQADKNAKKNVIYYPWRDILLGLRLTNKSRILPFVSSMQYEYLTTRDQSGALYHDPSDYFNEQMDGADNYYNHGIYPGWHHWGMGIGNPLIISPVYNANGDLQFRSNRIIAHNAGVNGTFEQWFPLAYRLQYTYSEHWGSYSHPFNKKKYSTSLLAEFVYALPKRHWAGTFALAYDQSDYIGNSFGLMFTVSYTGGLNGLIKR